LFEQAMGIQVEDQIHFPRGEHFCSVSYAYQRGEYHSRTGLSLPTID
jgi:hypothetical protein